AAAQQIQICQQSLLSLLVEQYQAPQLLEVVVSLEEPLVCQSLELECSSERARTTCQQLVRRPDLRKAYLLGLTGEVTPLPGKPTEPSNRDDFADTASRLC